MWHSLVTAGLAGTILLTASCGSGNSPGSNNTGSGPPPDIPSLTAIAPSSVPAGSSAVSLTLYGSNFKNGSIVLWNGAALTSSRVSATQMTATIPAIDLLLTGTANVTVTNTTAGGGTSSAKVFTISAVAAANMLVQPVVGVVTPQNLVWDSIHGRLYVSIASTDTVAPNTIIPVNPFTDVAAAPIPAGNNPDLLSISSDSSYLWVGLDGDNAVQRFLLPGLTKDISFPMPVDWRGDPQQPVSLQAAPVSPHTVAVIPGHWGWSPTGDGIYVYDDATQRPTSIPGWGPGGSGPMIDWIQWGANDSTIYGNQYTTIDAGGVATMNVTSSGVSFTAYNGGQIGPDHTQYDVKSRFLYSTGSHFAGATFDPVDGSLVGSFHLPELGSYACTADSSLDRYYCVVAYIPGIGDVYLYELWVFDLNMYTLLNRVYFGASAGTPISPITGEPAHLVRWGNAGLALTTNTAPYRGNAGLFLIDGSAINPASGSDFSTGTAAPSYSWLSSLAPQQAPAGSGDVKLTITGNNFTPNSTACWNCSYIQYQFLPTNYVSSTQLNVTIPAGMLASSKVLPLSVFDSGSNLFSSDSLSFVVTSASSSNTKITAVNLAGFSMAWDSNSGLLYVGTAHNDGAYPNSIVAVDQNNGSVVKHQTVGTDPDLVSVSAKGQYLYAGFAGATAMTQLQLPGLVSPLTWTLNNPASSAVYWAGDMRTAPMSPHTTAVDFINLESSPEETGGVVIYDDNVMRPNFVNGWSAGPSPPTIYDTLAWSSSDQILTAACTYYGCLSNTPMSPLYEFHVTQSGAAFVAAGPPSFTLSEIHSDFGTGLIYSDDGNVADPSTQAVVGTYNASGLVAPDSSLNRVFILGQTAVQANTNNYTIESFDEQGYTPVSSITLESLQGIPIQLIRSGTSGLAVLTIIPGSSYTNLPQPGGMLFLIQDTTFVSSAKSAASSLFMPQVLVQQRWKRISKADIVKMVQAK